MIRRLVSSSQPGRVFGGIVLLVLFGFLGTGCELPSEEVRGHLRGQITVRSDVDDSGDHSGFRVLVVDAERRSIDTLGSAVTDRDGRFETAVTAPERGIYTLTVWGRRGQEQLGSTDYVVAEGDSATLTATFPMENRSLRVRSNENAALAGYQNTLAQHRQMLLDQLQGGANNTEAMDRRVRQTSSVLWNLRETFPGTYAGELAATESLSLLSGWNDSLVVARAQDISPSNPRYVEAAQIARRSMARMKGQEATLELLDTFESRAATDAQRAGVQAVRVRSFIDSLQEEAALSAAQRLKNSYSDTKWAEWADEASYEVQNLLPGKEAPSITARTLSEDTLSLHSLRGRPVVLEYFDPGDDLFGRQLSTRNALYEATRSDSVAFVSVSVEPDTLLHRAFVENRSLPGHQIIAPDGREDPLVTAYNVADVPARFLIDPEGRIVGRYEGTAFLALQEDLAQYAEAPAQDREPDEGG